MGNRIGKSIALFPFFIVAYFITLENYSFFANERSEASFICSFKTHKRTVDMSDYIEYSQKPKSIVKDFIK